MNRRRCRVRLQRSGARSSDDRPHGSQIARCRHSPEPDRLCSLHMWLIFDTLAGQANWQTRKPPGFSTTPAPAVSAFCPVFTRAYVLWCVAPFGHPALCGTSSAPRLSRTCLARSMPHGLGGEWDDCRRALLQLFCATSTHGAPSGFGSTNFARRLWHFGDS